MTRGFLYSEIFHLMVHNRDRGSYQLSSEFMEWLFDNKIRMTEERFTIADHSDQYGILFETDEDAMAFKLRWS